MRFQFRQFVESIFTDKDFWTYLGLILISIIASVYGFYNPNTITPSETQRIIVVLDSKPEYAELTGDNPSYILFKSLGYSCRFEISHCALSLINPYDIENLNIGDTLEIDVLRQDLIEQKIVRVYGIKINGKGTILNLERYNSCAKGNWKTIYYLGLTFIVVFGLTILWKIIKQIKNNG